MKFIFFNLMAVIAILYLVAVDGKPVKPIPELLASTNSLEGGDIKKTGHDLAERARQKLVSLRSKIERKADTIIDDYKPVKVVEDKPKSNSNPRPKSKVKQVVEPQPKPVKVAVRPVNKVPPIVDAPPLRPIRKIAPTPKLVSKPVQKFMSRTERRRELNKLAHDMEMMFADKLAQ